MENIELNRRLVQNGLLSEAQLRQAQKDWHSSKDAQSWGSFLIEKKLISENDYLKIKSEAFGVPVVDLRSQEINPEILQLVPEPMAHRHRIISFEKTKTDLSLAMADPNDLEAIELLSKKTGLTVKPFLIGPSSLEFGLSKYHSNLEGEIKHLVRQGKKDEDGPDTAAATAVDDELKMAQEIPVVRVVDTLLEYAVIEKASDIHIEPQEKTVAVRYRIDGVLHDVMTLPKVIQAALVARIKVLSNLKIDEHRLPQDGRFKIEKENYKFSLRVSTIPVFDGEKVVIRLLDESSKAMTLEQLGFLESQLDIVRRNIHKPHGMMLITGPTGSGKSTTLYAILSILNTKQVNISTIEDPIEYHIVGANQMQVNPKINLTFALGLRALLRQDPNIIMIGEIRDKETAEEAMHAAMTGHIVLSTLHTNSAAGALPRLIDIGIEPYLIASTVNAVMAQRLVRMICQDCKIEHKLDEAAVSELSHTFNFEKLVPVLIREGAVPDTVKTINEVVFYQGQGCNKCGNTGYRSRVGIHEVLEITPKIGSMITSHATSQDMQEEAENDGMIVMWHDGFIKAARGLTTIDEILRVTKE